MKSSRSNLIYLTITFLVSFVILSFFVTGGVLHSFDYSSMVKLQSLLPGFLILPFSLLSVIGKLEFASLILLILLIFSKGLNRLLTLFLFFSTVLVEFIIKLSVVQETPPRSLQKTFNFFNAPTDSLPHGTFAYPSGHSARTAFLSAILIFIIWNSERLTPLQKKILIAGVVFFDFLMFTSRVYLGEHWLTDVVGGALLGFGLALLTRVLWNKTKK